jgi:lysophospholipase L1-like esterase
LNSESTALFIRYPCRRAAAAILLVPALAWATPDFSSVVALGDSFTSPWPFPTYVDRITGQLGLSYVNLAVPGAGSGSLLQEEQHTRAINDYGATFAFLWIGGNDLRGAAQNGDLTTAGETGWIDAFEVNFATAIDTLQAGGADVIVATTLDYDDEIGYPEAQIISDRLQPRVRENTEIFTARLIDVATTRGVPVVNVYTGWEQMVANPPVVYGHPVTNTVGDPILGQPWYDLVHPNELGHRILANMFIDTMNDAWGLGIDHVTLPEPATLAGVWLGTCFFARHRPKRGRID